MPLKNQKPKSGYTEESLCLHIKNQMYHCNSKYPYKRANTSSQPPTMIFPNSCLVHVLNKLYIVSSALKWVIQMNKMDPPYSIWLGQILNLLKHFDHSPLLKLSKTYYNVEWLAWGQRYTDSPKWNTFFQIYVQRIVWSTFECSLDMQHS